MTIDAFTPETGPTNANSQRELPRGLTGIAWTLITLAIVGLLTLTALMPEEAEIDRKDPIGLTVLKLQARMLVGLKASGLDTTGQAETNLETLNTGTIGQRLRIAAAMAEVTDPEAGREVLEKLRKAVEGQDEVTFSEEEARAMQLLETLLATDASAQPAGLALDAADRAFLVEQLDWFGELALVRIDEASATIEGSMPPNMPERDAVLGPAIRVAVLLMVGVILGIGAGLIGLGVLITLVVMAGLGRLRSGIRTDGPHFGVYAETFFIWFLLFFGMNNAAALLPWGLGGTVLAFFGSMIALGYPVIRGIPWQRVRQDIGLTAGRSPLVEPLLGPVGYAICLPLLAVGLLLTLILITITGAFSMGQDVDNYLGPTGGPAHPIIQMIEGGDALGILLVFIVASVAAPVVEETFFRGVLYAHLRGVSRRLAPWISIAIATLVNSFIFAVIHPQGFVAVPALMSLAIGMTILREWRGTLIPSMLIHGISNGLVMTLMTIALAG